MNPLLQAYLVQLAARPVLTKSLTSASTAFLSEIASGYIAHQTPTLAAKDRTGIPPLDFLKRNHRAIKLAIYGFAISAPLSHTLLGALQRLFEGKTSARAKLLMLLCAQVFISPIQQSVYLASMAVIGGATTSAQVLAVVKKGLLPLLRITWVVSPLTMVIAQRFLGPELWVPFFTLVAGIFGTAVLVQSKKAALKAAKDKKE